MYNDHVRGMLELLYGFIGRIKIILNMKKIKEFMVLSEEEQLKSEKRKERKRAAQRAASKKYYENNKEKLKEYSRKYYYDHKDQVYDYQRNYNKKHKDDLIERRRKRHLENREQDNIKSKKYYYDHKEELKVKRLPGIKEYYDNFRKDSKCVVYAYRFRNSDELVYIGSSNCLIIRNSMRKNRKRVSNLFDAIYRRYPGIFEQVVLFEHDDIKVVRELEKLLIQLFRPIFNVECKNVELGYLSKLIGSLILWNYSIQNDQELQVRERNNRKPVIDFEYFNYVDFNNQDFVNIILRGMMQEYYFRLNEQIYKN